MPGSVIEAGESKVPGGYSEMVFGLFFQNKSQGLLQAAANRLQVSPAGSHILRNGDPDQSMQGGPVAPRSTGHSAWLW